ncbi:hypothetical protein HBI56_170850 [Parastagonospora nodorum]|uniref:Uncharacterized protein n=1 Tax=Phaeosphaeria nodorum (strain SN15 / ATCC MYA-4574 / FGSC 10173) TaxID=321614 RepID=A0A7U2F1R0_PHANO|nr:hypothetical protein HBH56_233670 [Parastagonospora nodorum]QRC97022.1 hypothetical protein JI435_409960 [Parastagonospora nodorum SN15]KAH3921286.1 hypothetical protein HBH54_241730 [Parastagonospora nodorum]KAH3944538.1 hypothetical protein HBH53_158520 [Parastagonospora nodorum]KAH3959354.1 hypothetical protein HBH52_245320 [Parastagonospora nodorum]
MHSDCFANIDSSVLPLHLHELFLLFWVLYLIGRFVGWRLHAHGYAYWRWNKSIRFISRFSRIIRRKHLNKNMQMVYCSRVLSSKRRFVQTSSPCPFMLWIP